MDHEQNEKQTSQPTEQSIAQEEITRPMDTALLKKENLAGYLRTVRIDDTPELEKAGDWGNAFLGKRAQLNLTIVGKNESSVQVTIKDRIVVGRTLPNAEENADLDLTPYDAVQLGVSRQHAMITNEGNMLKVVDLDSTNGTFLNGKQLRPNQPRVLRTGDKLHLGQLIVIVIGMS